MSETPRHPEQPPSQKTGAENSPRPEGEVGRILDRKVTLARAALFWEALWPSLFPPAALIGLYVAVGLFGLWQDLPPLAHFAALIAAIIAIGFSLVPLFKLRWPSRAAGRARLDDHSGLAHRPAESMDDHLGNYGEAQSGDKAQSIIWQAHRLRLVKAVASLRAKFPRPKLWEHDPYGLRVVVILLLVIGASYAGPDWRLRISSALAPGAIAQKAPVRLDGWIVPPSYTARPPIFLADGAKPLAELASLQNTVEVPENSGLVLRLHNAEGVKLLLSGSDGAPIQLAAKAQTEDKAKAEDLKEVAPGAPEEGELHHLLTDDVLLSLDADDFSAEWRLKVIADAAPEISLGTGDQTTNDDALKLTYSVKDDYGVVSAKATFAIVETEEVQQLGATETAEESEAKLSKGLRLKIDPPDFDLMLPGARVREATRTAYKDLTAHPWAGLQVKLILNAVDEAGQSGTSEPRVISLPQRRFVNPFAKAVVEQRRNLAAKPWHYMKIAEALNAITLAPELFIEDKGIYLGLRTAIYRLQGMKTDAMLTGVIDLLWDIALRIEDGDLSLAERELRAAQDALERALAEGASEEEIERLLAEMRQALKRFMQAMVEEAQKRAATQPMQQPVGPDQKMIQSQDIEKLMDMIEQMSRSGANDAAQKLLEQLRDILENLETATAQTQMSPEQSQMSDTLDELSRMLAEQQRLMDETFRQNGQQRQQQQGRQPGDQQGQQPGEGQQRNGRGQEGQGGQSLAQRQEALRQQLQQLMDQMAEGGLPVPGQLPRAGDQMGNAEGRLSQGEPGRALGPQGSAIDQLRQGTRSLAQQLADGLAVQQGRDQNGQPRADGSTDPLGRPRPSSGPDFGLSVKIPDEIDAETARQLRQELQNRLGDRTRRLLERDYLERLLERF